MDLRRHGDDVERALRVVKPGEEAAMRDLKRHSMLSELSRNRIEINIGLAMVER